MNAPALARACGRHGGARTAGGGPAGGERGLTVLAHARWPAAPDDVLPDIPGFILSSFSPLVAEVARRCLGAYFGPPPADPARGGRMAVLIASPSGDLQTAAAVAQAVDEERRVPPLLFFQSNHNAVAGHIAGRWGLGGPVLCTIPTGDALEDARASAELLVEDGDADAVLVVVADQARAGTDHAIALLIGPSSWPPALQDCGAPNQNG